MNDKEEESILLNKISFSCEKKKKKKRINTISSHSCENNIETKQ